jgi:hypothetical protein
MKRSIKSPVVKNLAKLNDSIHAELWSQCRESCLNADKLIDIAEAVVAPLPDGNGKRTMDMIAVLIAATGVPPKVIDVVRALGIPYTSQTIVYSALDSLVLRGFLLDKEEVAAFGGWGQQNVLMPIRNSDGSIYEYRQWPVAREVTKKPDKRPTKKAVQSKFRFKS